ncbi:MAG TPA: tripartite tricarboxylate transporter substrate binding protein [Burkholderiaceae bacterium]|nr:tripartite tricarboxylate transporter substrate binding protein [Burkholderiaceae bacterium]
MSHLMPWRWLAALMTTLMPILSASPAHAQGWPDRPIRWIIPYAPGGTSDTLTRLVGQKLGERLGQPIVIENKVGAGGNIGTDFVAKAPADGYTMILGNIGPMAVNRTLNKNLPYDPERDFSPITLLMAYGNVIMLNNDFPAKSLKELIEAATTKNVPYAGNGVGTSLHLTGELLARRAGARFVHVPYRGGPPGLTDAIGGVVPMAIEPIASSIPMIKTGRLRGVAVTSPQRSPQLPDVPTVAEQGYPGFEVTGWVGVLVRSGTPDPIVQRLVAEFTSIMELPEIRRAVEEMGSYVPPLGPDHFGRYIRSETARWRDLINAANIKVE